MVPKLLPRNHYRVLVAGQHVPGLLLFHNSILFSSLAFFLSATLLCVNVDPEWILVQGCRAISAGCL
jgi:hypothetical protein